MTNSTSEPPNTTTKLDFCETSSACPSKMGEGRDGPSHSPLPKVLVRSEEESLKLNHNHEITMNVEQPSTIITGLEDKQEDLPLQNPALVNYNNINSLGFFTRARAHLLRDLNKESDNWENDDDFLEARNELAGYNSEISLLNRRIESYELALSLIVPSAQSENVNIPQPSPLIPIVEADVIPPDKPNTKLDLGETSSACPSKMGEGRDGPSHSPLPKVLVRSEEESLKLLRSQLKEDYLLRIPKKPKHKSLPYVLSPQELQTVYAELLNTFSDPLTSVPELQLVEELRVSYENNKVLLNANSYAELVHCVQTLLDYDEYKYNLLKDPTFARSCDTFDTRVEPTSTQDILVALIMHPSSGKHGMSLFDELVYTSFYSDYFEEEGEINQIQPVMKDAVVHLHSISNYTNTSAIGKTTTNNLNKFSTTNQLNEEYLQPVAALQVPDESSQQPIILTRALHLTPIGIIIPEECDLLTACLFPESVYPNHHEMEPTPVSSPSSTTAELLELLSCSSSSPMELALAALLLEAKTNDDNIRTKESLSAGGATVQIKGLYLQEMLDLQ